MTETIAFDSTRFVEEAIRDDFNTRFIAGLPRCHYRISADDFTVMVDRLSAKVEYGSPSELDDFGYRPVFVTLNLGGGAARVSPARDVVPGTLSAVEAPLEQSIAIGDVVRLKSGSEWMTVEQVATAQELATCVWFAKVGGAALVAGDGAYVSLPCSYVFPLAILERQS